VARRAARTAPVEACVERLTRAERVGVRVSNEVSVTVLKLCARGRPKPKVTRVVEVGGLRAPRSSVRDGA
jgi:hypothetical protein